MARPGKKGVLAGTLIPLLALLALFAAMRPGASEDALAEVSFDEPVPIERIQGLAEEHGVRVEMVQGEFVVGVETWQEGISAQSDEGNTRSLEDLKKERLASFADMVNGIEALPEEEREEFAPQLEAMEAALKSGDPGPMKLNKASFVGDRAGVRGLIRDEDAPILHADIVTKMDLLLHPSSD